MSEYARGWQTDLVHPTITFSKQGLKKTEKTGGRNMSEDTRG